MSKQLDKQKKLYIAGHTGLVGGAVLRHFQEAGYGNLITKTRKELDLLNQKAVLDFFAAEKPAYVIVSAARVGGIKANMENPAEFLYENLQIQNNIIWAAHQHGVEKLLFLGSSCIYPRESAQPIKEEYLLTGELEPTNEGYALAKIAGMRLCEYIYREYGKIFISCMPTNIYGEGDTFDPNVAHVIPSLIKRMHDAKVMNAPEVVIWGSGKARREFLHADDLADAVVFLMEQYDQKEFLNVGIGEDISIYDLAHEIKRAVGYEGALTFDTSKPDGMLRKLLDVTKLHSLGWKHSISFEEGIARTYRHFLEKEVAATGTKGSVVTA